MDRKLLLAFLATASIASAEPIKLNGLAPGMTQAQLESAHKGMGAACGPARTEGTVKVQTCLYSPGNRSLFSIPALDKYNGIAVDNWSVTLKDGVATLVAVTLAGTEFDKVVAKARETWGKPESEKASTTQNRLGEKFDQLELSWKIDGTVLLAKKRQSRVDRMGLYLSAK